MASLGQGARKKNPGRSTKPKMICKPQATDGDSTTHARRASGRLGRATDQVAKACLPYGTWNRTTEQDDGANSGQFGTTKLRQGQGQPTQKNEAKATTYQIEDVLETAEGRRSTTTLKPRTRRVQRTRLDRAIRTGEGNL